MEQSENRLAPTPCEVSISPVINYPGWRLKPKGVRDEKEAFPLDPDSRDCRLP